MATAVEPPTIASLTGIHAFTPRDRWNSLCVCGLSIAAHDAEPAGIVLGLPVLVSTRVPRDRIAIVPVHAAPKERATWPSIQSPFQQP